MGGWGVMGFAGPDLRQPGWVKAASAAMWFADSGLRERRRVR